MPANDAIKALAVLTISTWLLVVATVNAGAQSVPPPAHSSPTWEIAPYVAGGPTTYVPDVTSPERTTILLGVRFVGTMLHGRWWSFGYAPEVTPLLIVTNNPRYETKVITVNGYPAPTIQVTGHGPTPGVGVSPVGFELQFKVGSRLRLYSGGQAGFAWFTREVPVPESRAFNYTAQLGAGLQWRFGSSTSVLGGCMFHHLSNAGTGQNNPGLTGPLFILGIAHAIGRSAG